MLSKAKRRRRSRRHGFLSRAKNVLKSRRRKGRKRLSPNQK